MPAPGEPLSRRAFLARLGALPLVMPALGAAALAAPSTRRSPRALILLWLDGGLSHVDSFDCKPESSPDVRGALRSIRGKLPGTFVNERLARVAARLDRVALLRSLSHGEGNHDRGAQYLLCGTRPSPVLASPALGAIAALREERGDGELPAYIAVPDAPLEGGAGFLPPSCAPFAVGGDPSRADFAVRDLTPRARDETQRLLAMLDAQDGAPRSASEAARDRFVRQAHALAHEDALRDAFALAHEPAERRARYGAHRLGQSCLLATRLVQHGARVVLVRDVGWDHHRDIARELDTGFPPKLQALDEALGALLDDLREGPLADRAVLCVASEFGRTPRLNPSGGRDHWPRAQSVLLAGAGVRAGVVVGSTDARGEEPSERPLAPPELFATLVHLLGVPDAPLTTQDGRPVRVVADGVEPIHEVLAP